MKVRASESVIKALGGDGSCELAAGIAKYIPEEEYLHEDDAEKQIYAMEIATKPLLIFPLKTESDEKYLALMWSEECL